MGQQYWRENIKEFRKKLGLNQEQLALQMKVSNGTISNWELGNSSPDLEQVQELSKIFGISIDDFFENTQLIKKSNSRKSSPNTQPNTQGNTQLKGGKYGQTPFITDQLNEPNPHYYTGKAPALVTVNEHGIDNIIYVPVKARAGYLVGFEDPVFIESLPSFRMPGLSNNTFRMFEVEGISMNPTFQDRDRVIAEWVPSLAEVRDNRVYVIVHKEGVAIKRVINRVLERNVLYLKSDTLSHRADYPIIEIIPEDITEIWYVRMKVSFDISEPAEVYTRLADLELNQRQILKKLGLTS